MSDEMQHNQMPDSEPQPCSPTENGIPKWAVDSIVAVTLGVICLTGVYSVVSNVGHTRGATRSASLEWQESRNAAQAEIEGLSGNKTVE